MLFLPQELLSIPWKCFLLSPFLLLNYKRYNYPQTEHLCLIVQLLGGHAMIDTPTLRLEDVMEVGNRWGLGLMLAYMYVVIHSI